ncbi:unnamed protein product [Schistosoma margrebowiei]|uniref:SNF-related serine/threonine-protein kinase n=1 Tax=Schistosoma margrebowiei TaxID=48269 RepID=A0AA84ZDG7_9TREM|nr:unnamed protein product [Schistosoma margrebowiei]
MCDKPFFYNPDIDTKIAGLYDLQHTIGRGHYAVVKQARHVFTGEKVAVKVIDKTKLDNVSRDHLFQEVVCMKLVQHPNVVRLYEVIDTPTKLYLVLELGDGGDLYDYITSHGDGLSEKVAKRYFRQIVTAIAYCHKLRVVHRDLKPENVVFFEKLGLVKLTDFGFSNKFIPGTNLDTACGSLAYSAPEILLGDSYDAPKVDIWSLGVILYMLVSGNFPFQETNDSETLTKIMDCDYSMPSHLSPDCKRLISRLLIRDPQKRAHLDDILPSRSDSDTSFLEHHDTSHLPPNLDHSFSPEEPSDESFTQNETKCSGTITEISDMIRNNHRSILPSISGMNKRGSTRSPHRTLSNSRKTASWCSSAPILCETSEQPHLTFVPSNNIGLTTLSLEGNSQLGGSNTVREHCTPIREEDDEVVRSGESTFKTPNLLFGLNHRRKSESSSMHTSSTLFTTSNITRDGFATLAESESTSTISQLPNTSAQRNDALQNGGSSQCTTLSSLATSLRDSRYMIDIIRGTFELQCQYNRRFTNSIAGVSSCEYNSSRPSTSTSVRSLTAISEGFRIENQRKEDSPLQDSQRLPLHHRDLLHPLESILKASTKSNILQNSNMVKNSMNSCLNRDFPVTGSSQKRRMSLPASISGITNTDVACSVSPVLESIENNFPSSLSLDHSSPVRFDNFLTHNHRNGSCKSVSQSTTSFKRPSHLSSKRESFKKSNISCLPDHGCSIVENMNSETHNNSNNNNNNNISNYSELSSESVNHWTHKSNTPNHKQVSSFILSKHRARLACCSVS